VSRKKKRGKGTTSRYKGVTPKEEDKKANKWGLLDEFYQEIGENIGGGKTKNQGEAESTGKQGERNKEVTLRRIRGRGKTEKKKKRVKVQTHKHKGV